MRLFLFHGYDSTGMMLIVAKADTLKLGPSCAQLLQQRCSNTAVLDSDVC